MKPAPFVVLISCLLLHTNLVAPAGQSTRPPNIILIMADDLGYAELGSYGQQKILTPCIDRLARGGMRFTQFYSGSAVCAPARCNLLTGRHGGNAYIRDNGEIMNANPDRFGGQTPLPASMPNIAKTLKAAGYATGCFGKWGLGAQGTTGDPLNQGFDEFYGYNCQRNAHNLYPKYLEDNDGIHELSGNKRGRTGEQYAPQLIADRVMKFVREHRDKPFFLYYPTVIPHLPLQVPEKDLQQYLGKWPETPYRGRNYQPHDTPRACYAAMISFMDRQMGRLHELLKELGLDDNTVILFTSDNGTSFLKQQVDYTFFNSVDKLRGLKGELYEGGIRVPMIVHWPGMVAPNTSSDHLGAHYDIPATLAAIAGTRFDDKSDGISLLPLLRGNTAEQQTHEFLFWDFAGKGGQNAVRMGKWKGLKRGLKKNPHAPLQLYNLDKDISEKHNLAEDHPELVAKLEAIIRRERRVPELERFRFGHYQTQR
ncbi:MAG: arylsulfatase [Akkermansiaceae bacterium]